MHLNPVRISALGLGPAGKKAEALGLAAPDREKAVARLKALRTYRWSSYRAYGNYTGGPDWLKTGELRKRSGGAAAYREFIQQHVTRGQDPCTLEKLTDRVAVGSQVFLDQARALVRTTSREQPDRAFVAERISFERIVNAVEKVKGEPWAAFQGRYGDWGLAMVLYLARMHSGLTLRQIGEHAGGMDYKAVSANVSRFKRNLESDATLRRKMEQCAARM